MKELKDNKIFLVQDTENNRLAVKKILKSNVYVYEKLKNLEHKFLPKIYDVTFEDDKTIVIEEYIKGGSIAKLKQSEKIVSDWFLQLCEVLKFLHNEKIIHRDIKPSNILLGEDGNIRLIDFDASREEKSYAENDTQILGTKGYAPPEQYGFAQTDVRTDIYALGVTLKKLLGKCYEKKIYRDIIKKMHRARP